jgi:LmbE family N-acetylglucosaminyl deacetylase
VCSSSAPSSPGRLLIIVAPMTRALRWRRSRRAIDEGRGVALATLRAGGGGVWCGKDADDHRSLAAVRRGEVAWAAKALGSAPLFTLDYRDGALDKIAAPARLNSVTESA